MVGTFKEMEARQGKTFSFQLSTHGVDKLSRVSQTENGHYIQQLDPPVYIPFNAEPKLALYDLSFANSFANIDPIFKNQTVEWYQSTSETPWEDDQHMSIVVPKGNYNLSDIEIQIAKELLKTHDGTEETIWGRMDTAAKGFMVPPDNNTPAGVASPNIPEQFSDQSLTPPLTFLELQELLSGNSKVPVKDRFIKPITLRHNPQTNRIEIILLGHSEIRTGSTLLTVTLGYDESQLATATEHWEQIPVDVGVDKSGVENTADIISYSNGNFGGTAAKDKQSAANIDNTRAINFHLPGLVGGSYDTNGALGNGRVATVPITVKPGESETWQVSAPLFMPCDVAGAYINEVEYFITNENNHKIDDQGGRISATVVLSWPAPAEGSAPPSSLQGRTDLESIRQPWANMYR